MVMELKFSILFNIGTYWIETTAAIANDIVRIYVQLMLFHFSFQQ